MKCMLLTLQTSKPICIYADGFGVLDMHITKYCTKDIVELTRRHLGKTEVRKLPLRRDELCCEARFDFGDYVVYVYTELHTIDVIRIEISEVED